MPQNTEQNGAQGPLLIPGQQLLTCSGKVGHHASHPLMGTAPQCCLCPLFVPNLSSLCCCFAFKMSSAHCAASCSTATLGWLDVGVCWEEQPLDLGDKVLGCDHEPRAQ